MEQQTQILGYIDRQTEKITQRIRVLEYIIDDLKSRRNTMPVTEFFTLYEQFSMKLKDLETERNSLLNHYSRGSAATARSDRSVPAKSAGHGAPRRSNARRRLPTRPGARTAHRSRAGSPPE